MVPPIFISGVHSGPNPSPGLGVALCLREAYGDAKLMAVDYSRASTGLHHQIFDEIVLQQPWNELDLAAYGRFVRNAVRGAIWIPGLDLEIAWFRSLGGTTSRYVAPRRRALSWTAKPGQRVATVLGMEIPASLALRCSDEEAFSFLERHGPRIWLKGPRYDAWPAENWEEVSELRDRVAELWSGTPFLQAHISGTEGSFAFAAWDGVLIDAVLMHKRATTQDGKTWAGEVGALTRADRRRLEHLCSVTGYTGGGEIEFVQSHKRRYLIDFNPRFPAWIRGAAHAGHNLPASLVAAALGTSYQSAATDTTQFVRVVTEIPVREGLSLPLMRPDRRLPFVAKHPSGMPLLAKTLGFRRPQRAASQVSDGILNDLRCLVTPELTPVRVRLATEARERFVIMRAACETASLECGIKVEAAYSLKTDPDRLLVQLARTCDLAVEAISSQEIDYARREGFAHSRIVVNGPTPWRRPGDDKGRLLAWFADSEEALVRWVRTAEIDARYIGVRVRPSHVKSRFGVPARSPVQLARLSAILAGIGPTQKIGFHFHVPATAIGVLSWMELLDDMLEVARRIEVRSGRTINCFDVGGGWPAELSVAQFTALLREIGAKVVSRLPAVELLVLEPGRFVAQPSAAVLTRVIERRQSGRSVELIVDASIAELPMLLSHPHRILFASKKNWLVSKPGRGRILGRSCMEADVLATDIAIPSGAVAGSLIAVCDAGGYDASMSYDFAIGPPDSRPGIRRALALLPEPSISTPAS